MPPASVGRTICFRFAPITPDRQNGFDSAKTSRSGVWTPDGRQLLYYRLSTETTISAQWATRSEAPWMWAHDGTATNPPTPIAGTLANAGGLDVSPDGRWIAYHSDESGQLQVYVQSYPGPSHRYQVFANGGNSPVWRAASELGCGFADMRCVTERSAFQATRRLRRHSLVVRDFNSSNQCSTTIMVASAAFASPAPAPPDKRRSALSDAPALRCPLRRRVRRRDAGGEDRAIEAHVAECRQCERFGRDFSRLLDAMRHHLSVRAPLPDDVGGRLRAGLP